MLLSSLKGLAEIVSILRSVRPRISSSCRVSAFYVLFEASVYYDRDVSDMIDVNVTKEAPVKKPPIETASWCYRLASFLKFPLFI